MESQELAISWLVIVTSQCCVSLCYPDACSLLLNITSFLTDHLVSRYVFLDISFVFCILGSVHHSKASLFCFTVRWIVASCGRKRFLSAQMLLTVYFISRVSPRMTTSYGLPQGVLPPNLYIHTIPFIPPLLHLHIVTVNICQHHPALLACLSL